MIIARVIGELVATRKHESHEGRKLLRVQPEDVAGTRAAAGGGGALIALDAVGAGVGERVLVVLDGYAAMTAVERPHAPIDAAVIGILDRLDVNP
ncbi:MAG TPA: EutN/CcmL family microcompartment protein [Terriglobales bacterium]|jgi:ethanolamine utilization protein EutN